MDNLLPGFEPSEADMIQTALDMPLERKIEKAIAFYQTYCDGAYGAFSGGKDSCVIKELGVMAGVDIDWHYNNTTIDPPELVRFIKKHHADVKWNNQYKHMMTRMVEKANPPTRLGRWCCAEYKEQGGNDSDKVIGIRIAESARRAKLWQMVVPHRKTGKLILCPICYWTDEDVWAFIKMRGIPYCSLYDEVDEMGKKLFARLGCVGCPMAGPTGQCKEFERWPKYEEMWKRGFEKLWDKWHGVNNRKGEPRFFEVYGSAEAMWEWWRSGGAYKESDQCVFEDMMSQR